jgi:hypothetical protein
MSARMSFGGPLWGRRPREGRLLSMPAPDTVPCPRCRAESAVLQRATVDALGQRKGDVMRLACPTDGELSGIELRAARRDGWPG